MATRTYKLPTVNAAGKMSFPDAVNGLATGVDYAMRGVQKSFGDPDDYKLPVATSSTLGGVRIGKGFKVFADGEIQPEKSEFVLKPATASALGGVAIGKNVDVDDTGKIIAGAGAFQSTNITESELAFEAVTGDKIRKNTLVQEDFAPEVINKMLAAPQIWNNAKRYSLRREGELYTNIDGFIIFEFVKGVYLLCYRYYQVNHRFYTTSTDKNEYGIGFDGGEHVPDGTFGDYKIPYYIENVGYSSTGEPITLGVCKIEFNFENSTYTNQYFKFQEGKTDFLRYHLTLATPVQ